jgi:hypothetical protein
MCGPLVDSGSSSSSSATIVQAPPTISASPVLTNGQKKAGTRIFRSISASTLYILAVSGSVNFIDPNGDSLTESSDYDDADDIQAGVDDGDLVELIVPAKSAPSAPWSPASSRPRTRRASSSATWSRTRTTAASGRSSASAASTKTTAASTVPSSSRSRRTRKGRTSSSWTPARWTSPVASKPNGRQLPGRTYHPARM